MNMLRRLAIHAPNSSEQGQAFQEFMEFNKFVRQLDEGLMRKYSVNVLESLEKEARTLRYLTIVFCKKQRVCSRTKLGLLFRRLRRQSQEDLLVLPRL